MQEMEERKLMSAEEVKEFLDSIDYQSLKMAIREKAINSGLSKVGNLERKLILDSQRKHTK